MSDASPDPAPCPAPLPKLPPGFDAVPRNPTQERRSRARLTVVGSVYHHPPGASQSEHPLRWTTALATDEQPWRRWFMATADWQPLEAGWLAGTTPALLVLTVDKGQAPLELGLLAGEVAEVTPGTVVPLCTLPAGQGLQLPCPNLAALRVRSVGTARCCLTLIPS